jgi:transposase
MAKVKEFTIKEDISTLKTLRKQQSIFRIEKRIIWLIELHQNRFKTRIELAKYLGVSTRAQERWSVKYRKGGIKELLFDKPKKLKSKIITSQIHKGLSKRVNSSDTPFLGYWDAVDWVKSEYNVSISYHLLRYHLIKHFKTKLKSPRKSHYKKDDKAVTAFLKTP